MDIHTTKLVQGGARAELDLFCLHQKMLSGGTVFCLRCFDIKTGLHSKSATSLHMLVDQQVRLDQLHVIKQCCSISFILSAPFYGPKSSAQTISHTNSAVLCGPPLPRLFNPAEEAMAWRPRKCLFEFKEMSALQLLDVFLSLGCLLYTSPSPRD